MSDIFEGAACYTAMAGMSKNKPSSKTCEGSDQGQAKTKTKITQAAYAGTRAPKTTKNPDLQSFTAKK